MRGITKDKTLWEKEEENEEDQRRVGGQRSKRIKTILGVSWCEVQATAAERIRWRYIVVHCPAEDWRI